eukprot:TRINITY_DN14032_c0_g1_i2.p1 TRINITY_DN14032_c0_g1~~TRINITY_DN14032_c0_g1_i2.p1  ORF type:complete len:287 (-),score=16.95 TRINITY_DN14032_c0_g1_i2:32-892(-)
MLYILWIILLCLACSSIVTATGPYSSDRALLQCAFPEVSTCDVSGLRAPCEDFDGVAGNFECTAGDWPGPRGFSLSLVGAALPSDALNTFYVATNNVRSELFVILTAAIASGFRRVADSRGVAVPNVTDINTRSVELRPFQSGSDTGWDSTNSSFVFFQLSLEFCPHKLRDGLQSGGSWAVNQALAAYMPTTPSPSAESDVWDESGIMDAVVDLASEFSSGFVAGLREYAMFCHPSTTLRVESLQALDTGETTTTRKIAEVNSAFLKCAPAWVVLAPLLFLNSLSS